jgi:hypothetical protein
VHSAWTTFMQKWIDYPTASIQGERDKDAAPDGIPAQDLAISLNLMNERTLPQCPLIRRTGMRTYVRVRWAAAKRVRCHDPAR